MTVTIGLGTALVILLVICGGTGIGMHFAHSISAAHLSDQSKSAITVATAVVGTASALVLGLLISSASSAFSQRSTDVVQMATDIIRLDGVLRDYGSPADIARKSLAQYADLKLADLFPNGSERAPLIDDTTTMRMLDDMRKAILALGPTNDSQHWLKQRALQFIDDIAETRWTLALRQNVDPVPVPFLVTLVFWLTLLFGSFGLFAPRNPTVIAILGLCALAVSSGVGLVIDMTDPFNGFVRVSSLPMQEAIAVIRQ
jgi:hypothetical protein